MSDEYEAIKKETAEKIATYLEDHWEELNRAWLYDGRSQDLRDMIARAIGEQDEYVITKII